MKKASRLWLWLPWAAFALIVAGWLFYWHAAEAETRKTLAAWFAEQNAAGAHVQCAEPKTHGFPVLLRLELTECAYAPAGGKWRAELARADLNVNLLNPGHVILSARSPIDIAGDDGVRHILTAQALLLSARMSGDHLAQAGLEIDSLALDNPDREGEVRARKLVVNIRPDARAEGDYQFSLEAEGLGLARPVRSFEEFGQTIEEIRAAIVFTQGALLFDAPKADPLGPWRDADGAARFEALSLNWGPLRGEGQGVASLDAENRIVGRLDLDIPRPGDAIDALADSNDFSRDTQRGLELIAAGFALTGQGASFEVTAEAGGLEIEDIPVRQLAPIY